MATPDPEVEEILATLGETPLAWLAAEARSAVEDLPELRGVAPGSRLEATSMQLSAIEKVVLEPMQRELTATKRIADLAEDLGLSSKVELLLANDEGQHRIVLNGEGRLVALETFIETLARALGEARERVAFRGQRDS